MQPQGLLAKALRNVSVLICEQDSGKNAPYADFLTKLECVGHSQPPSIHMANSSEFDKTGVPVVLQGRNSSFMHHAWFRHSRRALDGCGGRTTAWAPSSAREPAAVAVSTSCLCCACRCATCSAQQPLQNYVQKVHYHYMVCTFCQQQETIHS